MLWSSSVSGVQTEPDKELDRGMSHVHVRSVSKLCAKCARQREERGVSDARTTAQSRREIYPEIRLVYIPPSTVHTSSSVLHHFTAVSMEFHKLGIVPWALSSPASREICGS